MLRETAERGFERSKDGLIRLYAETEKSLATLTPELIRRPISRFKPYLLGSSIGLALITKGAVAQSQADQAICSTELSWIIPLGLSALFIGLFGAGLYRSGFGFWKAGDTNQGSHQEGRDTISRATTWNIAPSFLVPSLLGWLMENKGLNWLSCVDVSSLGLTIHATDLMTMFV